MGYWYFIHQDIRITDNKIVDLLIERIKILKIKTAIKNEPT